MNATLRVLLSVLSITIAVLVIAFSLCAIITDMEVASQRFLSWSLLYVGSFSIKYPTFHVGKLIDWLLLTPGNLNKVYMEAPWKLIVPFAIGALTWLMLEYICTRVLRLFANKKTTLHGSAKWATEEELENLGMLGKTGVILGQTYDAEYTETKKKPPKRRDFKSAADYREKMENWSAGTEIKMTCPGDLITQKSNAHMLIVGSTRSGKGISCIIPTEFKWPESIIIFDPKAEGWDVSAAFRSRFSYTFKFQPEKPEESIHYNPLLSIRRGTFTMPDIQNLSFSLIALNEQSKDPFWDNEARKLLAAVIGYVIYCMPPERKTFREVYSIFTAQDKDFMDAQAAEQQNQQQQEEESLIQKRLRYYAEQITLYIDEAKQKLKMSPELKAEFDSRWEKDEKTRKKIEKKAEGLLNDDDLHNLDRIRQDLSYFAGCEERQLSSVVSTMMSNLQVIADPNVQAVTDRSDFTMEDFVDGIVDDTGKKRPVSLYLCMSLASMQRLIPIMKIFYEQAITLLTRCTPEECKKRPYRLLLIFDEFRQMGKMEIVERALALSAGYGVLCMIAVQSYEQLKTLYQSDALFTDNFAYQVILRVNDDATCKKVESMLGQGTMKHTKLNSSGNLGNLVHKHESLDTSEMGRSLMTAEEVRTMDENDCLLIMSGTHPYKAKKIRYYQDERFTKLYRADKGKGKPFPNPPLIENYPHADTITWADKKHTEIKSIHGLDREGWSLLLGIKADLKNVVPDTTAAGDGSQMKMEQDVSMDKDFLKDSILNPGNQTGAAVPEENGDDYEPSPDEILRFAGISDLDDMNAAFNKYYEDGNDVVIEEVPEAPESKAGDVSSASVLPW